MGRRAPSATPERRPRRVLIGLAVLFFAPLGLAFFLYYGPIGWRPPGHVNHGDLINPPRPLPDLTLPFATDPEAASPAVPVATDPKFLKRKWTLLYWGPGYCYPRCRTLLHDTRQVRIALNRDMDRVQRVFIADGTCCDFSYLRAEQPDLIVVTATQDANSLLEALEAAGIVAPKTADRVYLIDPLGNLMMSYAPDAPPKGMLEDLRRLLGLSHVG